MNTENSPKYQLNSTDLIKILKGMGIALGGAGLTYIIDISPNINFGQYTPFIAAIMSILINVVRKWITDNTPKEDI